MKLYDESKVAGALGVPCDEMAVLRSAMDEGAHYVPDDGLYRLTGKGIMAVLKALDIDEEKLTEEFWSAVEECLVEKKTARRGPPVQVEVTFLKLSKNRRVLICEKDGDRVRLQVKGDRNQNFVRGMMIPATHIEGDLYRINCPSPKKKGRWC